RRLIRDLDSLPFPAYDLVDMTRYGRASRNHPALVSIEHSRGCIDSCSFCILWKHMGAADNGTVRPRLRSKSAERSFSEVMRLWRDFGRRTFGWVDPTFNALPRWTDKWADLMLSSPLCGPRGRARTLHTAWMRADCALRDERLGILEKLVRAGLRQVVIGVERLDADSTRSLGKRNNTPDICREAFALFREKYPQVYTIGSVIFGLPGDTEADLRRLIGCEAKMGMDYCFIIPLTPNPGTDIAEEAVRGGYVANTDFANYNFHTPVCRTNSLDLRDLEKLYWRVMLSPDSKRIAWLLGRLFGERDARKRRVHAALASRGALLATKSLLRAVFPSRGTGATLYSRRPSWYDK
ncbi:MAG: radical SAM protein, partial [Planctomycetia bacterium]|nr:radical SAM protein [Planctomycetia bacterium]